MNPKVEKINIRRSTPRCIIAKLLKMKVWKAVKEKQLITYKEITIKNQQLTSHQKQWRPEGSGGDMFKVLKEKRNHQQRMLKATKLFFKNEGKVRTFLDKQKLT